VRRSTISPEKSGLFLFLLSDNVLFGMLLSSIFDGMFEDIPPTRGVGYHQKWRVANAKADSAIVGPTDKKREAQR
jgi:heme/copper-type cytochrome/quinol oxidase subunit 3